MMPLAPPVPSRSVRPCRWFPARNGGSRSVTAFHDPGSTPIEHRAPRLALLASLASLADRDNGQFLSPCLRLNRHKLAAPPVPYFPRFRALALLGRRPNERAASLVDAGVRETLYGATVVK
jgi:hypothetical protein